MAQPARSALAVLARLLLLAGIVAMHFPGTSHVDGTHASMAALPAAAVASHHTSPPAAAPLCAASSDCVAGEHDLCLADRLGPRTLLGVPASAPTDVTPEGMAAGRSRPSELRHCRGPDLVKLGVSRT